MTRFENKKKMDTYEKIDHLASFLMGEYRKEMMDIRDALLGLEAEVDKATMKASLVENELYEERRRSAALKRYHKKNNNTYTL